MQVLYLRNKKAGAAAWTPANLFASSEAGGWYDASISASMWQETGESTSAGDTEPVGRWKDQSGNGLHLDQSTASLKPVRHASGGLWYVAFDGSDDVLLSAISASAAQPFVMAVAIAPQIVGSNNSSDIWGGSQDATNAVAMIGDTGSVDLYCGATLSSGTANVTGAQVLLFYCNGASSYIRKNGVQIGSTGNAGTRGLNQPVLGRHPTFGRPQQTHIYAAVFRAGTLSSGDQDELESWLAGKCGVSL